MSKTIHVISPKLEKIEQKMINKMELNVETLQDRFDTLEEHSVVLKEVTNQILKRQDRLENTLVEMIGQINESLDKNSIILNEHVTSFQKESFITFQNQSQDIIG
ncbi:V-type ATPase 116kDa subunit family protein [Oceanobacillus chungangensis]|nr:V-type ATPase 116kDa subunit family protein [Oceanobacillus chungangensis]